MGAVGAAGAVDTRGAAELMGAMGASPGTAWATGPAVAATGMGAGAGIGCGTTGFVATAGGGGATLPTGDERSAARRLAWRAASLTGSGSSPSCSGRRRQRSFGRSAVALADSKLAGPPREEPLCGSSETEIARLGTGRSMIGTGAEDLRPETAGVDDRREGSSRRASLAPQAGHVMPVVWATEKRAAHLGQMIVIAKIPPGFDYITGDGGRAAAAGNLVA